MLNTKTTKKELLDEIGRLQKENARLMQEHRMNTSLFDLQESRLDFFQMVLGLTPQEQASLVPVAHFLERLAKCPLLSNKPKA